MTRTELSERVALKTGNTTKQVDDILKAAFPEIIEEVKTGEKVSIAGFGTFETSERAERKGRNPHTGDEMVIPASRAPKFKAGKAFKDAVNE